jgi:hypothetical protein
MATVCVILHPHLLQKFPFDSTRETHLLQSGQHMWLATICYLRWKGTNLAICRERRADLWIIIRVVSCFRQSRVERCTQVLVRKS